MSALPGRPREFTFQKRRELIDHIGQGATIEEAARIVGVSLRTVQRAAKYNECFDHDLQLALHAAPADPYQLVARAARTHWRAAAWLLERTDPDRFAKRPPNSCRPETLMDVSDWLIETALESTPPELRETVYRRMRTVADKALDVLMPDQQDARRGLVGALPERPMPLSDHEAVKTLRGGGAPSAPAVGVQTDCAGRLPAAAAPGELAAERPTASSSPRLTAAAKDPRLVADPVAYYRAQPPRKPPAGRPDERIADFRLLDSDRMDAAWRYPTPDEVEEAGADSVHHNEAQAADSTDRGVVGSFECSLLAPREEILSRSERTTILLRNGPTTDRGHGEHRWNAVPASSDPPNGGIMSPKMSAATQLDAAEPGMPPVASRLQPDPPAIPIGSQAASPLSAVCSAGFRRGASASA